MNQQFIKAAIVKVVLSLIYRVETLILEDLDIFCHVSNTNKPDGRTWLQN